MSYKNGHDDPKVASLEEARRAAEQAKMRKRYEAKNGPIRPARTLKDWVWGLVLIAMALGYIAWAVTGIGSVPGGGV
jgi:hypothetical protein